MPKKSEICKPFDELKLENDLVKKNPICKKLKNGQVTAYFESVASKWTGGGGYIHCSQNYEGHRVLVIVLKEKSNGK